MGALNITTVVCTRDDQERCHGDDNDHVDGDLGALGQRERVANLL